jgi:aromatic ring-cleaving dioxygenase
MKTKPKTTKENQVTPVQSTQVKPSGLPTILGIAVNVDINAVCEDVQYTFTGMTVNRVLHYEIPIFEKRYRRSASSIRRDIDRLTPTNRPNFCLSVGKKQYVNEGLLLTGKRSTTGWKKISEAKNTTVQKNCVGICGDVAETVASQLREDVVVPITGVTTSNRVHYIELEACAAKYGVSVSTLRKDLKEIFSHNRWSRERFRYVLTIDGKHYISPVLMFLRRAYRMKLKNTEYAALFAQWAWNVCGTSRFYHSVSEVNAVDIMRDLCEGLKRLYPGVPAYFAYVTERDPDSCGYHNHFVYGNQDNPPAERLRMQINELLERYGGRYENKTHIESMRFDDYFLEYMVKDLHRHPDSYGVDMC